MPKKKKSWTQDQTKELTRKIKALYDEAIKDFGAEFTDNVAYSMVAFHPEHNIDGVATAAALSRQGMNHNILKMMGLTVNSMAQDFAAQSGKSLQESKAYVLEELLKQSSQTMYRHGIGLDSSFDGAFLPKQ